MNKTLKANQELKKFVSDVKQSYKNFINKWKKKILDINFFALNIWRYIFGFDELKHPKF